MEGVGRRVKGGFAHAPTYGCDVVLSFSKSLTVCLLAVGLDATRCYLRCVWVLWFLLQVAGSEAQGWSSRQPLCHPGAAGRRHTAAAGPAGGGSAACKGWQCMCLAVLRLDSACGGSLLISQPVVRLKAKHSLQTAHAHACTRQACACVLSSPSFCACLPPIHRSVRRWA